MARYNASAVVDLICDTRLQQGNSPIHGKEGILWDKDEPRKLSKIQLLSQIYCY